MNMTDDRNVKESMRKDPKYHAEMAQRTIGALNEELKKPNISSNERGNIESRMKSFYDLKRKFEKGIPLDTRRF